MQSHHLNSSFVFPPEAVVQNPVVLNSDFTFTCHTGVTTIPLSMTPPQNVPNMQNLQNVQQNVVTIPNVPNVTNVPIVPNVPSMPNITNMSNLPLNMFTMDHSQASQVSQIISPAPSSPLEYRDSPTADELDIPEFFQYSKEKYESQKIGCKRRRKSSREDNFEISSMDEADNDGDASSTMSHAEFRRQIHIQSEQKRRAEIKDGFEELRRHLPTSYTGRKMSKAVLLQKAVSHLKNTSRKENFLLDEINRLTQTVTYLTTELDKERRMNAIFRQKHAISKLYDWGI
ncbi:11712_t:CDS:2 [Diversispora eburnea]|uniref:11712_t:CDS:1 n=1 Tax=Diversispora eburnea TaxID=1213867 RepID=A0A9N8V528_9GLOM|nr:11712_t:CDS:2 [Diversispora eburnea]